MEELLKETKPGQREVPPAPCPLLSQIEQCQSVRGGHSGQVLQGSISISVKVIGGGGDVRSSGRYSEDRRGGVVAYHYGSRGALGGEW